MHERTFETGIGAAPRVVAKVGAPSKYSWGEPGVVVRVYFAHPTSGKEWVATTSVGRDWRKRDSDGSEAPYAIDDNRLDVRQGAYSWRAGKVESGLPDRSPSRATWEAVGPLVVSAVRAVKADVEAWLNDPRQAAAQEVATKRQELAEAERQIAGQTDDLRRAQEGIARANVRRDLAQTGLIAALAAYAAVDPSLDGVEPSTMDLRGVPGLDQFYKPLVGSGATDGAAITD